jgi:hypothetical protein
MWLQYVLVTFAPSILQGGIFLEYVRFLKAKIELNKTLPKNFTILISRKP